MKPTSTLQAVKAINWIAVSHSCAQAAKNMSNQRAADFMHAFSAEAEALPVLLEKIEDPKALILASRVASLARVGSFDPERDSLCLPRLLPVLMFLQAAYNLIAARSDAPAEADSPLYWELMQQQSSIYAAAFSQKDKPSVLFAVEHSKVYRDLALCVRMARLPDHKTNSSKRGAVYLRASVRAEKLEKLLGVTALEQMRDYSDEVAFFLAASEV
jgi:hypothetical protein